MRRDVKAGGIQAKGFILHSAVRRKGSAFARGKGNRRVAVSKAHPVWAWAGGSGTRGQGAPRWAQGEPEAHPEWGEGAIVCCYLFCNNDIFPDNYKLNKTVIYS